MERLQGVAQEADIREFYQWVHTKRSGDHSADKTHKVSIQTADKA